MTQVYHYDAQTGVYQGTDAALPNPRDEGAFLLPAHATFTAPPQVSAGRVAVFDAVTEVWATRDAGPEQWAQVRTKRNGLLNQSDWTQLPDSPLSTAQKTAWAVYRQALRDITTQADPAAVVWPVVPRAQTKTVPRAQTSRASHAN